MPQHECTDQRMTLWSRLSPSNLTRVLETKLRSSGLPQTPLPAKPSHQPTRNKAFEHGGQVEKMACTSTGDPNCTKQKDDTRRRWWLGAAIGRERDLRRNLLCDS